MKHTWKKLILLGCSAPLLAATSSKSYLVDSFEQQLRWELKEWGDKAQLDLASDAVSDGRQALRVSFSQEGSRGQKKIVLRRSVHGYAKDLKAFELDVFNPFPGKNVELALAIEADQYYETDKISLTQGWNRKLHFAIDQEAKLKSSASNWEFTAKIPDQAKLGSLILLIYTGGVPTGSFAIDNIRSLGPMAAASSPRQKATIMAAPTLGTPITLQSPKNVYEPLELQIPLEASYNDPYNGQEIAVEARFESPSQKTHNVSGFLYKGDVTLQGQVKNPEWRLRFTPNEAGKWTYQITAKNPQGAVSSGPLSFEVAKSSNDGFLRVDPKDRRYFSFDSGRFYYPIGQNTAWDQTENYKKMFAAMKANGQNWARLWMSHWSFGIEWKEMGNYKGLGNYNLANAERLDQILKLAEENGIYVQLVFEFHGALSSKVNPEWPNNPYNKVQGGMLDKAQDFFTDLKARDVYKQRLAYVVARWGHSPAIMAWEFFNEINFADDYNPENEFQWHKDMSQWLRKRDPYQHMITTSYYDYYNKDSYQLATIDFTQYHAYHRRVWKTMEQVVPRFENLQKPFFFGEFGSDSGDGVDAQDKKGIFLHAGIWVQAMQPVGGNAMPWWWDTQIQPNQLYSHFGALTRYLGNWDRRQQALQPLRESWPVQMQQHTEQLNLYGLKTDGRVMGWIADAKGMHSSDRPSPQTFKGIQFALRDLPPGEYKAEYWDTYKGEMISTEKVAVKGKGEAILSLPAFTNDLAFKLLKL